MTPDSAPSPADAAGGDGAVPGADGTCTGGTRLLSVLHETRYDYDDPVEVAHHSARLRPRDTALQRVLDWTLTIDPEPDGQVQESSDAFGNWRHGFSHALVHDTLSVQSRFRVRVCAPPPLNSDEGPAWELAVRALGYRAGVQQPGAVEFRYGSRFAPVHPDLAAYAAAEFEPGRPLIASAMGLMRQIHRGMVYKPHATDVATNALQVLAKGKGVCQDFAHLMIGAMRSLGLAASYVSGYLLTHPPPGRPRLVGADASHAWVAVWCPLNGWVALDPTNHLVVAQDHVTLAWGRDYADVAPLRGVIRGGGGAPPVVAVTVAPADAERGE